MSRPPALNPAWLVGLLHQWAIRTSRDKGFGYPTICVMLRSGIPGRVESYDPTGYGDDDFLDVEAAVRSLRQMRRLAVMRYFAPWSSHAIDSAMPAHASVWLYHLKEAMKELVCVLERPNFG